MSRLLKAYLASFSGLSREVWLLSVVMLINRSGTMVLPFLSLYLTSELGFSLAQAGGVLSAFGLGAIVGSWLGGRLTDRFGYYVVQVCSLFLGGVAFLMLGQLQTEISWYIGIFLTSVVVSTFRPANTTAIGVYADPKLVTRSITLNRLAINLGWAIGPAVAGWLAHSVGYEALFWVNCASNLLAAFFYRFNLSPKKSESTPAANSPTDKEAVPVSEAKPNGVWQNRPFLLVVFFQMLVMVGFMQVFSTLPIYLEEVLSWNEGKIGLLLGLNGILIVIIEMPLVAWLEKRYTTLQMVRLGTIFVGGGLLCLFAGENWVGFVWVYAILITIGEMVNFPFGETYALSLAQPHNRGRYMGVYGLAFSGAFVIAPLVGTHLAEHGSWNLLWGIMGGLSFLAAWGIGRINQPPVEKPESGPLPADEGIAPAGT
ncbi:MAG: MFS transporter [Bacteroidota bacterium]